MICCVTVSCSFEETAVVTKRARWVGWVAVIFINLFFVYFSLLRAMTRSHSWQNQYVMACVIQLFIEVLLFESATVIWVHWVIPRIVCGDVNAVIDSLRKIIKTSVGANAVSPDDNPNPLDTTDFFFVSKAIARQNPELLESSIALSFHSYFPPGRMMDNQVSSRRLGADASRTTEDGSGLRWFLKWASLSGIVIGLLQLIGTLNMDLQTFIMSLVLPFMLVVLALVSQFLVDNPLYMAAVGALLLYLVIQHFRKEAKATRNNPHGLFVDEEEETHFASPDPETPNGLVIVSPRGNNEARKILSRKETVEVMPFDDGESGMDSLGNRAWGEKSPGSSTFKTLLSLTQVDLTSDPQSPTRESHTVTSQASPNISEPTEQKRVSWSSGRTTNTLAREGLGRKRPIEIMPADITNISSSSSSDSEVSNSGDDDGIEPEQKQVSWASGRTTNTLARGGLDRERSIEIMAADITNISSSSSSDSDSSEVE